MMCWSKGFADRLNAADVKHRRVPAVYLTWANPVFLAFFAFNGINNLRVFNVASSSTPTAPSATHPCPMPQSWGLQAPSGIIYAEQFHLRDSLPEEPHVA
jgi:hypothetical protein